MNQINAFYNGVFDLLENIKVSPLSRAYTFSDSVYEVVPFVRGKSIAHSLHMDRLKKSSENLNITFNLSLVSSEIKTLIDNCKSKNGYVYYQISRGIDEIRSHIHSSNITNETFGYAKPYEFKIKGIKVLMCDDLRWGRCDIKSTSLLGNVMQMNEASKYNCEEVIMFKGKNITEGGASNVFFVKNNEICTPSLSSNILPGITRSLLIENLKKKNIVVNESKYTLKDIKEASSIWFTSSTKPIAPVIEVRDINKSFDLNDDLYLESLDILKEIYFI